jgi:hypothetical protein
MRPDRCIQPGRFRLLRADTDAISGRSRDIVVEA